MGLEEAAIHIPIGKWGDINDSASELADASVLVGDRRFSIEVKLARINIANKTKGQTAENWAFNNILRSPSKSAKKYDILFAVGVRVLGFENPNYWAYFQKVLDDLPNPQSGISEATLPHEAPFLELCGAFVLPFSEIPNNHFRVTLRALEGSQFNKYFSWLRNRTLCKSIWDRAIFCAAQDY